MNITIDVTQNILNTERLVLRAWKESDLQDFFLYASVPGVGEMAGWTHHKSPQDTEKILANFIEGKEVYALEHKQDKKVIGSLGIHNSWANNKTDLAPLRSKEIGYVLSKDYWNKGLMTEAVQTVISFYFTENKLDILTSGHFLTNLQSKRVLEKCGFRYFCTDSIKIEALKTDTEVLRYVLKNKQP